MSTMPCPAVAIPLARPWPRRLADALHDAWRRWRQAPAMQEADLAALATLNPQLLRDIGAPDWVQERARGQADPFMQTAGERRPWWWTP